MLYYYIIYFLLTREEENVRTKLGEVQFFLIFGRMILNEDIYYYYYYYVHLIISKIKIQT